MLRRALATTAIITLAVTAWAPATLAAEAHGKGGGTVTTAPGKPDPTDSATHGNGGNKSTDGTQGKGQADGKESGAPAGTCSGTSNETTAPTDPATTPADTTTTDETATTPADSTTTNTGETAPTTPAQTGNCQGQANHLEAVQKVMTNLQDKLDRLNPTAAANVADVIAKLEDELKASGVATDTADADAQLEAALTEKASSDTSTKSDLDVLAEVQAKQGKDDAARTTREQRIQKDPSDKDAYVALGQTIAKKGQPDEISAFVAGKKVTFDVKPVIKDGRTLVPVRAMVEALGADVQWDPTTSTVTITKGDTKVVLVLGQDTATINGETVKLDVPATSLNGRTVVPARFVAEILGMKVDWIEEGKLIVVTDGGITSGGATTTTPETTSTPPETTTTTPETTAP